MNINDFGDVTILEFDTAIQTLVPNSIYRLSDGVFIWEDNRESPTKEEIQEKIDALKYIQQRQAEYPSIESLVVGLYDTDDKSAIEAKRAAVKAKYPKPE